MSEEERTPLIQPAASANPLPEVSAEDFKIFNYFADKMDSYHSDFREIWGTLYDVCVANELPKDVPVEQFIETGTNFCNNLHIHHEVEEKLVFPYLGQRMPAFKVENSELELLVQHKRINAGLTTMQEYLSACEGGKKEFEPKYLKAIMDGFGEFLWLHMDDEVDQLRADKMRAYWSVEEIKAMPFYEPVAEELLSQIGVTP
ncbi:hypothetical protein EMPG_10504 [Blastomyces silverae]|uniref:Hemerythrin-like domain-containing protein n=1 Tax=Blastomyces silverae TaxID=2060906 RepID=A0A0H1B3V3_9EURO|nr:hypothetical protein EMPG_10504 [Blastomyces silverae]